MENQTVTRPDQLGQLQAEMDRLKADVTLVRRDLTNFAEDAFHAARTGAAEAREKLNERARTAGRALRYQAATHPLLTVGGAIGMGLLLGVVLGRRSNS
jgi:ElaB/YqjD/DUF883 family membrane-anchored ribosome-binding protein